MNRFAIAGAALALMSTSAFVQVAHLLRLLNDETTINARLASF